MAGTIKESASKANYFGIQHLSCLLSILMLVDNQPRTRLQPLHGRIGATGHASLWMFMHNHSSASSSHVPTAMCLLYLFS